MKFLNWMIDTVYDLFEYLIMLAVVTIAIFIIFWRLDGLFGSTLSIVSKPSQVVESTIKTTKESVSQILNSTSLEGEKLTVNIPEGTSSEGIANILFEYELINSKEDFIKEFDSKFTQDSLPFGSFEFEIGSSLEKIFEVLEKK
ncbi:hypothetical protein [Microaceticoccus formicicus]|uniref:hypothetical protein n=1 Tax=Microaceticoccus formicicus TaxID=3118105 RepID=UPI003CD05231|nr:hypothetical protein VZL98_05900 [Peptoniphilaceae bacterium AMB_02]